MISKKLPGAEPVYMVYDKRDRLVLTQDGNMRNESSTGANKYLFTRYDEYNRPVITGQLVTSNSLETIRTLFKNDKNYVPYEEYTGSGTSGYTSQSYPSGMVVTSSEIETLTWYDTYDFVSDFNLTASLNYFSTNPPSGFETTASDKTKGIATGGMVKAFDVSGSGYSMVTNKMYSVSYYDDYGNVIQTISQNHLGGRDVVSSLYQDVTHQLMQTQQQHILDGSVQLTILETYDYDHAGRLLETTHQVNDQDPIILNAMRYNELGELVEKYLHAKEGSNAFVQKVDFQYNIRGWLTQINNPVLEDNDLFGMKLYYNDASSITGVTADKQFNGNIAAMQWNTKNDKIRGYGFQYDALNRLTNADYGEGTSLSANQDLFSMSADYDKNGNIDWLKRNYNGSLADDLNYKYVGNNTNKLEYVLDEIGDALGVDDYPIKGSATKKYDYDPNGNMIKDPSLNSNINYNSMNLPVHVDEISGTNKVDIYYYYDASGRKLAKLYTKENSQDDKTIDYVGNIVYENNEIAYIQTSEGRMIPIKDENGTRWHYEYALKDHLGNTRVTFGGSLLAGNVDIIQQSHYYPFGLVFKQENYQNSLTDYTKNKYLYNGKELQDDQLAGRSLNWYDYGARMYDPSLGRWHVIDNKAEKYYATNPYTYAVNNPIIFIDPDGNDAVIVITGVVVQNPGPLASDWRGSYNMYQVKVYEDMTLQEYGRAYKSGNLGDPTSTTMLARDAWSNASRSKGDGYGSNNEAPPGLFWLNYNEDGFGTKKHKLRLSDNKGGHTITSPDGTVRTAVDIHEYSPHFAEGCLTTGSNAKSSVNNLIDLIPSLENSEDVRVLILNRGATWNEEESQWEGISSEGDPILNNTQQQSSSDWWKGVLDEINRYLNEDDEK